MELKPCPFCGSLSVFLQRDSFAKCDETEEFASKSWNERH